MFFIISLVIVSLYEVVNSGSSFSIVVKGNISEKFDSDEIILILKIIRNTLEIKFENNFIIIQINTKNNK